MAKLSRQLKAQNPQVHGYERTRARPPKGFINLQTPEGESYRVPFSDVEARKADGWIDVAQRLMERREKRLVRRTNRIYSSVHPDRLAPMSVVKFLASIPKAEFDILLLQVAAKRKENAQSKIEDLQKQLEQAIAEAKGV